MRRLGFLPVFFIVLGIAFAAALFLRIRSHQVSDQIDRAMGDGRRDATVVEQQDSAPQIAEPVVAAPPRVPEFDPPPLLDATAQRAIDMRASASAAPPIGARSGSSAPATAVAPSGVSERGGSAPAMTPPQLRESARRATRPQTSSGQTSTGPAQHQQPAQSSHTQDRTGRDAPPEPVSSEPDPTSDSTPPRLLSVEFVPAVVADGEETLLVIHASDDLSGIRSVSGTILAPSGAVQGFAGIREGDTSRFVARVVVPKDAAEGVWAVNYLNMMDNASNSAALTAARGTLPPGASFRVTSSRPDSEGPSLEAVWIDRRSMRGGEKNLVHVRARDDKSGVNLVSGIFRSPAGQARVGFVCRPAGDALWACELAAPACADCGDWQLEQLQMQDKANNITTVRAPQNELVAGLRVDISSDLCDNAAPAMQSLLLSENVVSNLTESTVIVTARLTDDACGVLSVSGQATGPQSSGVPPRLYFSFTPSSDPSSWTGRMTVPRLAAKGVWRISFVQVLDRGQNLKTYAQNDPLLANATFLVQ